MHVSGDKFRILWIRFLSVFTKLWKVTSSFIMSVHRHGTSWLPLNGFSWNLIFEYFLKNLSRKFKFLYDLTRITSTLCEDKCTFIIISHSLLLNMRNVSDKRYRRKNTRVMFKNFFFFKSCHLWDNVKMQCRAEQATDDSMLMHIACWITKL